MFRASWDFVVLSLDGSRSVEGHLEESHPATVPSPLDHYINRPATAQWQNMILHVLHFVQQFTMPKEPGSYLSCRRKKAFVIVRPFCSPDPQGPNYGQYCRNKLMLHVPFRHEQELFNDNDTFSTAYATFLETFPCRVEDDVHRLEQLLITQKILTLRYILHNTMRVYMLCARFGFGPSKHFTAQSMDLYFVQRSEDCTYNPRS